MTATQSRYTFVLKLTDKPGGMELIAATFAHRGISITSTLGNDSTLDPDSRATVVVTFTATPARKEVLKCALSRLARVVTITEHAQDAPECRKVALVRLAANTPVPQWEGQSLLLNTDTETGETLYSLLGFSDDVDTALNTLCATGNVLAVTHTTIAV